MMTPAEIRETADQMLRDGTRTRSFVVGMRGLVLDMTLRKNSCVSIRWIYRRNFAEGEFQKTIGTWPAVSVGAAIEAPTRLEAGLADSHPLSKLPEPVVEHFTVTSEVRLPDGRRRTVTIDYTHDMSSCIKVHEDGMPLKTLRTSNGTFKSLREILRNAATGQLSNSLKKEME